MGCSEGRLPLIYLGLPVGTNPRSKKIWNPMIQKIEKWPASWTRNYFSLDGRLTVAKLHSYYMSLFEMLTRVAKVGKNFGETFFAKKRDLRKVHLVKWQEVTKPKEEGGLCTSLKEG